MLFRRPAVLLSAVLIALAGRGGTLVAQMESAERGILPVDSTGTLEIRGIDVDVAGICWRVELGSLPTTINSGVVWGRVRVGNDVIAVGSLPPDRAGHRLRAVRIVVNGMTYDLHPEHARFI